MPHKVRVLLDQNALKRLIGKLPNWHIVTARQMGWSQFSNGDLITAAEREGFAILLTADRNLRYQQNLIGRMIAIVVLETNRWATVERFSPLIDQTLRMAEPGSFLELSFRQ